MNSSSNSRSSTALVLSARRLGILGMTALLSATLALGSGLPAHGAPTAPPDPPSPAAAATSAAEPSSPASAPLGTVSATPATTGQLDMEALRAEIGDNGAYMGQGLKSRAGTLAKKSSPSSPLLTTEAANTWMAPGVQGLDVSSHQSSVNWAAQYSLGARFAYVKATEGTTYRNPMFNSQYGGALGAGMIRGAYHFALPGVSTAVAQADYFINNGGGWSGDGRTMPPLLDIEYNPYASLGNTCYNMSQVAMVNWVAAFSNRVLARTGRLPMIYTTTDWWTTCTGNSNAFSRQPLHLASYSRYVGPMPNGWGTYSVWQYSATGPFAGDSNAWNGTIDSLRRFATQADGAVPWPSITSLGDVVAADSSGILWDYPATGNGSFGPRKQIGQGWTGLRSINAIDWNADGVLDIVAQWKSGRVNVYLGVASGGFSAGPVLAESGWSNYHLTIGYWLNSSFYPHIITRDDAGVLRLWRNTSGSSVSAGTTLGQGWSGLNLTMIDFDGDGNQDILAQNSAGTLRLYRSNGSGSFIAEARRTIGSGWQEMTSVTVTTNFKGAGTNGLLARNTGGQLSYYPVPGNGTWGTKTVLGTGWNPYLIAGGENVNLVAVAPEPPAQASPSIQAASDVVTVDAAGGLYRRTGGSGTLGAASKIGSGFINLASVHVTDWNADGIQDMATVSTAGVLGIHTGLAAGGFAARTTLSSGLSGADITIGPWIRASRYPSIAVRTSNGSLQIYSNPSGGALGPATVLGSGFVRMDVSMNDADGDGNQDILAVDYLGRMRLYRSGGGGAFIAETRKVIGTGWGTMNSISTATGFAFAASHGILARDSSGTVYYYPLSGGVIGAKSVVGSGWAANLISGSSTIKRGLAIGNSADVLTVDGGGGLWNHPATKSTGIGAPYQIGVGWSGMKSLTVVDWNSDNIADVLAQKSSGALTVYFGSASGGFASPATVAASGFAQTKLLAGKWVSGARYPGLVGYAADGILKYWANASGRTVGAPVRIGSGWAGLKLAMIDFDSDGKQDLLAVNGSGTMRLYRSTGANRFVAEGRTIVGSGWQSFRQFSTNVGFAGAGSRGVLAFQTSGELRYYPVVAGSKWGAPSTAGRVGTAPLLAASTAAN